VPQRRNGIEISRSAAGSLPQVWLDELIVECLPSPPLEGRMSSMTKHIPQRTDDGAVARIMWSVAPGELR
jgi:hypothetical protein